MKKKTAKKFAKAFTKNVEKLSSTLVPNVVEQTEDVTIISPLRKEKTFTLDEIKTLLKETIKDVS